MTARVKKEFRVLLLPWIVGLLAAFSLPVVATLESPMLRPYIIGFRLKWIEPFVGVCILVACLAMAALSFGVEIRHRTLGLLLVQPVERFRIWWSKMLPLAIAYISVGVAFIAGQCLAEPVWGRTFESWDAGILLGVGAFLAGVMCSGAFWTLLSRSIIGGMVLPLAVQVLLAGVITWLVSGTSTVPTEQLESRLFQALGAGAFVYCILFMYLGWRKFSRLQWREGFIGESGIAVLPAHRTKESQSTAPRGLAVPGGAVTSLVRKELRLHRPVFYLAALFIVCWFAAHGLNALLPAWEDHFRGVFLAIMVIYLPLAWLLSGSISLGEEKQLGTWGWHMTLPLSGARQWAVKISFALLAALVFGLVVPVLAWFALKTPYIQKPMAWWAVDSPVLLVLLIAVFCTALSFWSVTMFGTVVRAVLFTFLGAVVLLTGGGMMLSLGSQTTLFRGLCHWFIVEFQLPLHAPFLYWIEAAGTFIGFSLLIVLLLRQSYVHCRREPSRKVLVRCSLVLVVSLFLPLWLSHDISSSCSYYSPDIMSLQRNLQEALLELPASIEKDAVEKSRPVSFEEIDGTGILNPDTRRWLRGASIRVVSVQRAVINSDPGRFYIWFEVTFPNGRYFGTGILVERPAWGR